jgi:hypothetical protein
MLPAISWRNEKLDSEAQKLDSEAHGFREEE